MITKVPDITLKPHFHNEQMEKTIGNLSLYSFDFKMGGSSEPSSLSISFFTKKQKIQKIDPNGAPELYNDTYQDLDSLLGERFVFTIAGLFSFHGYIVDVSSSLAQSGDVGSILMKDTSIKHLDSLFIGLRGKDCLKDIEGLLSCFGEPIDPCPFDVKIAPKDVSILNPTPATSQSRGLPQQFGVAPTPRPPSPELMNEIKKELSAIDGCDPCISKSSEATLFEHLSGMLEKCTEQKNIGFLDFDYSLGDLMKIPIIGSSKGIDKLSKRVGDRAGHTGTLRSVLTQWCGDMGIDFYYDFSEEDDMKALVFTSSKVKELDLEKIKSYFRDCQTIETSYKSSIDFAVKGKSLRSRATGHGKSYGCESKTEPGEGAIYLENIGIEDLITDNHLKLYGGSRFPNPNNRLEQQRSFLTACLIQSVAGPVLRDIFVFQYIYQSNHDQKMSLLGFPKPPKKSSPRAVFEPTSITYDLDGWKRNEILHNKHKIFEKMIGDDVGKYFGSKQPESKLINIADGYASDLGTLSRMGGEGFYGNDFKNVLKKMSDNILLLKFEKSSHLFFPDKESKENENHFPSKILTPDPKKEEQHTITITLPIEGEGFLKLELTDEKNKNVVGNLIQSQLLESKDEPVMSVGIEFVSILGTSFKCITSPCSFGPKNAVTGKPSQYVKARILRLTKGSSRELKKYISHEKYEFLETFSPKLEGNKLQFTSVGFTNQDISDYVLQEYKRLKGEYITEGPRTNITENATRPFYVQSETPGGEVDPSEFPLCGYSKSKMEQIINPYKFLAKQSLSDPTPISGLEINIGGFAAGDANIGENINEMINEMINDGLNAISIRVTPSDGIKSSFKFTNLKPKEPKPMPDFYDEKTGRRDLLRSIISNAID